jgi:hypothetical protein
MVLEVRVGGPTSDDGFLLAESQGGTRDREHVWSLYLIFLFFAGTAV